MMNNSLLTAMKVLYVDHLAVTTPVPERTLREFLSLPGARLLKGPNVNPAQKVKYAFVGLPDGMVVEILSPESDSPIAVHVKHGGGPYHFCYAVEDLEMAMEVAQNNCSKLLVAPKPDVAFDGRRVAFLFHEAHGVFELVEAYPADSGASSLPYAIATDAGLHAKAQKVSRVGTEERLRSVFKKIFPALEDAEIILATINQTEKWDSLTQIGLMMGVESEFAINIPADEIMELASYAAILKKLADSDISE